MTNLGPKKYIYPMSISCHRKIGYENGLSYFFRFSSAAFNFRVISHQVPRLLENKGEKTVFLLNFINQLLESPKK